MSTWPHAPARVDLTGGTVIVTASTFRKEPLLSSPKHLEIVQSRLFEHAIEGGWTLEAWAIMSNHYHFVANLNGNTRLSKTMGDFHRRSALDLNRLDETPGRKVWFQFWDTEITDAKSYMARLAYVHQNPVRHGLVSDAVDYPFCSMRWFRLGGEPAFVKTVLSFPIDRVKVLDDF